MRLFKNKKAVNYSALIAIIVLIVVIYLFTQLYSKLDTFETRIGDQELALLNVYKEGDNLLLFVDYAAKYSVYKSVEDVAFTGGFVFLKEPAGSIGPIIDKQVYHEHPYWLKDGKKYYEDIDFYERFEYYLKENMEDYLEKYPAHVPYEFTITKDKVLGIPLKPVLLNIFPEADKKQHYGEVMLKVGKDLNIDTPTGLGIYAVRPSFSVTADTYIHEFASLPEKVDKLLICAMSDTVEECTKQVSTEDVTWFVTHVPEKNTYVFSVLIRNFENPYDEDKLYIRFALEIGSIKKTQRQKLSEEPIKKTERKIVFIPINWNLGEVEFIKAVSKQYNYFLSLISTEEEKEKFEKLEFFDNVEYAFGGGQLAVPLVENKVKKYISSYDKNKDLIVGLIPEMPDENVLGHVWGQDNIMLVKYDEITTLAHELGHSIWGFCDEYVYLDVSCQDSELEIQFRNEILDNPEVFLRPYEKVQNGEIDISEFVDVLKKSGFTETVWDNLDSCDTYGWLSQQYYSQFGPCVNSYPVCCEDNPNYLGDNNEYGINCIFSKSISSEEKKERLCAGAPCGSECRSIMGIEFPGLEKRKYPS